jgi:hypothetical protein
VNRLIHTQAAHVRALQISRFSLFAFVEGKAIDPNFFGRVCCRICEPRGVLCRILTAKELPGGTEGKARLVAFYRYARSKGKLRSILNGKVTVLVFFLDKDIDDTTRRKCRSKHVVYTAHYDVQNYVFRHGDFIRSVSAAASIDENELHQYFGRNWCETAARRWKEWITLCLFSVVYAGGRIANYRNISKVNTPPNGPVDLGLYTAALAQARSNCQLKQAQFERAIGRLTTRVEKHLSKGTYDLVFKGKWYSTLLEMDLRSAFPGRGQLRNIGTKATAALLATLDLSQPWAEHLLKPVAALMDQPMTR